VPGSRVIRIQAPVGGTLDQVDKVWLGGVIERPARRLLLDPANHTVGGEEKAATQPPVGGDPGRREQ
jgi:hypothetical protein